MHSSRPAEASRCSPARCRPRCSTASRGRSARIRTGPTPRDIYDALSLAVREELTLRWLATQRRVANAHVKRVCYSLGRISARPLPAERPAQPRGRSGARGACDAQGYGLRVRGDRGAGSRSGLGQRRPGPACGLFPRFAGDASIPGGGLRHPLRLRHLHSGDRGGRRPARDREQLAAAPQRMGDAARQRALHRAIRRPLRGARLRASGGTSPVGRHRGHLCHRFRSAHSGQPQSDRQSPAALVGARHHAVSHRRLQRRRLHRRRA